MSEAEQVARETMERAIQAVEELSKPLPPREPIKAYLTNDGAGQPSSRQLVKAKYPNAVAMHAGIHNRWNVYSSMPFAPGAGFVIGYGAEQRDAWADAAKRLAGKRTQSE
jgi:hypothetical protein